MDIMVHHNSNYIPAPFLNVSPNHNSYNSINQHTSGVDGEHIDKSYTLHAVQYNSYNTGIVPMEPHADETTSYLGTFGKDTEINGLVTEDNTIYEQRLDVSLTGYLAGLDHQQQLHNQLRKQLQLQPPLLPQHQEKDIRYVLDYDSANAFGLGEQPAVDYQSTDKTITPPVTQAEHTFDLGEVNEPPNLQFKCEQCNTTYTKLNELQSHLVVHSDYRPFQCTICGSKCKRKSDWMRHMKHHEGDGLQPSKYLCHGVINGRTWGCQKRYSRSDARRKHWKGKHGLMCVAEYCMALMDEDINIDNNALYHRSRTYITPQLNSAIKKVKRKYGENRDIYSDMATSIDDSK